MRRAEERRSASMMISSSIRWSLAGAEVDCSTNTSAPRTFSWISTNTSPSAKRLTIAFASEIFRYLAMSPASIGLELPATSLIAPLLPVIRKSLLRAAFGARLALRRRGHNKAEEARQYAGSLCPVGFFGQRKRFSAPARRPASAFRRRQRPPAWGGGAAAAPR